MSLEACAGADKDKKLHVIKSHKVAANCNLGMFWMLLSVKVTSLLNSLSLMFLSANIL